MASTKVSAKTTGEKLPRKAILAILLDAPVRKDPHDPSAALESAIDATFGAGTASRTMFSMPFSDSIEGSEHDVPAGYVTREGSAFSNAVRLMAAASAPLPDGTQSALGDALHLTNEAFDTLLKLAAKSRRPRFVFFDARGGGLKHVSASDVVPRDVSGFVCIEAVAQGDF